MDQSRYKPFLQRWVVTTLGVLVAAHAVSGIRYDTPLALLIASLLLGVINAFLRPLLLVLSLPLLLGTLGLFMLIINGFCLYLVGWLMTSFHVDSFWAAFWGGIVISIVSMVANWFIGSGKVRVQVSGSSPISRQKPPPPSPPPGEGPIIDV